MILLTVIAVGLLSLASISLRSAGSDSAQMVARANARLALMLALNELQTSAGDDRRITADASILGNNVSAGHAVGVWDSWSPKMTDHLAGSAPDYQKNQHFRRWLLSGTETNVMNLDWVKTPISGNRIELFNVDKDGFSLSAPKVTMNNGGKDLGGFAWAVVQENTKAKISVAGPELGIQAANDALQAQPRPSVGLLENFSQPTDQWNLRAGRVLSIRQAALDEQFGADSNASLASGDLTANSFGLLTDVVDGGLKVDLSLGFEMSQADFHKQSWSSNGDVVANPFHSDSESGFSTPASYNSQRPLYQPLSDSGNVVYQRPGFAPANVEFQFPVNTVPTFDLLRSFYRTSHYLYKTADGLTLFEREFDQKAAAKKNTTRGWYSPSASTVSGQKTQIGFRPILDRVMFVVSAGLAANNEVRIVFTPVVTLWNPYNTALEIEGATAFMWFDCPYDSEWMFYSGNNPVPIQQEKKQLVARLMGIHLNTARSVYPYFYAAITADGNPISGTATPIRFEPGEVRVFTPSNTSPVDFVASASPRNRTVFLRPVENLSQVTGEGGISVPTKNAGGKGFTRVLASTESVQFTFKAASDYGSYPFYITLADATVAEGTGPATGGDDHGKSISEILSDTFVIKGSAETENTTTIVSKKIPYAEIKDSPVPIGVLETYHRVARTSSGQPAADLVYTGNPRQPWMNPFITGTSFATGPQYHTRMRRIDDFSEVIETDNDGRSAFYGATQSSSGGATHLSFFEIPQAPMLSLAGFQHADLSTTPFAPANQLGNSWASAYVERDKVFDNATNGAFEVDHSYLVNESLWDKCYFSGAAPTLDFTTNSGNSSIWDAALDNGVATQSKSLSNVVKDFVKDPTTHPLKNARMNLYRGSGGGSADTLADELLAPEGCVKIAGHLLVDGAFNVNSTSVEAWKAVLAGLRGTAMEIDGSVVNVGADESPFSRMRDPKGSANDNWQGYRTLNDAEIGTLATHLVEQVIQRGPFLSLAEFVNRRISSDDMGLKGAVQAAIDESNLNAGANQGTPIGLNSFKASERSNITDKDTGLGNDTGVGIPGYLTQADVLHSLAPVLTVRSDTFIIRSYGEARDPSGNVTARSWMEATVQRVPDLVDRADANHAPVAEWNQVNQRFGRKFNIISIRYLTADEV